MRVFGDLRQAVGPYGSSSVLIVGMVIAAMSSIIAAFAAWITNHTTHKIHNVVNGSAAILAEKATESEKAMLALTEEVATLRERMHDMDERDLLLGRRKRRPQSMPLKRRPQSMPP